MNRPGKPGGHLALCAHRWLFSPAMRRRLLQLRTAGIGRSLARSSGDFEADLLAAFDAFKFTEPSVVVGFSLGAMSAIHLAARRAHLVSKLILISPAAPLQLGDFLAKMAGRPLFTAAQRGPVALRVLSGLQAALVSIAPKFAINAMFRTSPEADKQLLAQPEIFNAVLNGLRSCLLSRQVGCRIELLAYVRPWANVVNEVRCATEIWQGSRDDWTPLAMAEALKAQLGDLAVLNVCPGLGHYSTLHAALQRLD